MITFLLSLFCFLLLGPVTSPDMNHCADLIMQNVIPDEKESPLLKNASQPQDEVCAHIPDNSLSIYAWAYGKQVGTHQLRHLSSRLQLRQNPHGLHTNKAIQRLLLYLTTLINHITQSFTTLKIVNWQRSSDFYVFAYRHILI